MNRSMLGWIGIALVAVAGCATAPLETVTTATPGAPFSVRVGQEAVVEGTGLRIRFLAVDSDSRCPADVNCVWEGDAAVRLLLVRSDGSQQELVLHTSLQPRSSVVAGYRVSLESLAPAPRSDRPIRSDQYVAGLLLAAES